MKFGILLGGLVVVGGAFAFFLANRAGAFERRIATEIEVEASPERVWKELSNFDSYHEWNPFIPSAKGRAVEGEEIEVRIKPPNSDGMTFRPKVAAAESGRELRWLGRLLAPGIFDGEHYFLIERVAGGGTRVTQGEKFNGVLVPFLWKSLDTDTRRGFEEMNLALKQRVERAESGRN